MFARQLYPLLGKFRSVLEVGARGYNRDCKGMINSTTTKYYQVEPFPPDVMNNDGLLQCKVQEVPTFYPQYESFFDVAIDFIFGWKVIRTHFNTTEEILNDVSDYMDGMLFLLETVIAGDGSSGQLCLAAVPGCCQLSMAAGAQKLWRWHEIHLDSRAYPASVAVRSVFERHP